MNCFTTYTNTPFTPQNLWDSFLPLWHTALVEDLGENYISHTKELISPEDLMRDITSHATINKNNVVTCQLIAKEDLIICGLPLIPFMLQQFKDIPKSQMFFQDGDIIKKGDTLLTLEGNTRILLTLERTLLNILQHLSGIATLTQKWVKKITPNTFKLFDTRKTLPGYRYLEKYAVKTGGAENHRYGLFDAYLIKDNHIATQATSSTNHPRIREVLKTILKDNVGHKKWVEIECATIREVETVLQLMNNTNQPIVDIIMLDNFDFQEIIPTIQKIKTQQPQCQIEISGELNQQKLIKLNQLYRTIFSQYGFGFERVSSGFITHSSPAADISLNFKYDL